MALSLFLTKTSVSKTLGFPNYPLVRHILVISLTLKWGNLLTSDNNTWTEHSGTCSTWPRANRRKPQNAIVDAYFWRRGNSQRIGEVEMPMNVNEDERGGTEEANTEQVTSTVLKKGFSLNPSGRCWVKVEQCVYLPPDLGPSGVWGKQKLRGEAGVAVDKDVLTRLLLILPESYNQHTKSLRHWD